MVEGDKDMSIVHTRIDDRLIHGQVATMWTNNLNVSRIMVVDDAASSDDVLKMSLKLATPNGVSLSVLPVDKAADRINTGNYEGQRVLLIVKQPETLVEMIKRKVVIDHVNVGNLTYKEGRVKVANTVAVSKDDINAFNYLSEHGVKITLQLIPSNPVEDFMITLKKNTR